MNHNKQTTPAATCLARRLMHCLLAATLLLLGSCASKKAATEGTSLTAGKQSATAEGSATATGKQSATAEGSATATGKQSATASIDFLRRVADGKVYAQNITGDLGFKLKTADKTVSLPGSLHMRRDKVIRLQLFIPILGSEVGRLEFTPDHVLVVDRMHKRYARATYDQVSFLAANGLSFYSLQALFWNQLFLPGQQKVGETALKSYATDLNADGATIPLTLEGGSMTYQWNADKATARIVSATVAYASKTHGASSLDWNYADFRSVGVKQFPARQSFTFTTTARGKREAATVELNMSEVKTDSDWDAETTLSSKYKQIDAEDLLKNLMTLE